MAPDQQPVPLDPALLAAFRQQGAPIVTRERGLSATCRIKLAGIARGLGIGDEQIEEAIRSLNTAEPSAPPNAQVERFRRRLRKDLSGKSRTIIGPTIETQILAAAQRKYGLDDASSGQTLREVADELGLTVISASDAIQSLGDQIDQAARDSTWLAREAWDRLRSAGGKWGLELEVIDELIEERLAANRAEYLRRSFWTRATLYVTGGAVIAAGLIVGGLMLARSTNDTVAVSESGTSSAATFGTRSKPQPAWWDVDLTVEVAHVRSRPGNMATACDAVASSVSSERAAGYERLIELVRTSPDKMDLLSAASKIIAGCLALEPDESSVDRL